MQGQKFTPDPVDTSQSTPLHLAAVNGHDDLVNLLVSYKANLKAKDLEGKTP